MLTPVRRALFPLRRLACDLPALLAAVALSSGCSGPKPTEAVPLTDQACCVEANPKLTAFKGCQLARRECPKSHKWWMRGQVECGPVDEANCAGGRCCNYTQQYDPSDNKADPDWQPPGFPDKPKAAEPDPEPEPEPEPEPQPKPKAPTVHVTVSGDGTPAIDGETLQLPEFKTRICDAKKALPKLAVQISAQSDTAYASIAKVLEAVNACGVTSVSMDQTTD